MTTGRTVVRSGKSKRKPFNSNVADYLLGQLQIGAPRSISGVAGRRDAAKLIGSPKGDRFCHTCDMSAIRPISDLPVPVQNGIRHGHKLLKALAAEANGATVSGEVDVDGCNWDSQTVSERSGNGWKIEKARQRQLAGLLDYPLCASPMPAILRRRCKVCSTIHSISSLR